MTNSELKPFRNLELIEARSARELKNSLAKIAIPFKIVWIYYADSKHYALINPVRPLTRKKIISKSPRDTDKIYKES